MANGGNRPGYSVGNSNPRPAPPPPAPPKPPPTPAPAAKVPIPAALAGKNPLAPTANPVNVAAKLASPTFQQKRALTIMRRQSLLHGLGLYKGELDGFWGPKSQKAWSIYIDRKRKGKQLNAPYIDPAQLQKKIQEEQHANTVAAARQAAALVKKNHADAIFKTRQMVQTHYRQVSDNVGRDRLESTRVAADVAAALVHQNVVDARTLNTLIVHPQAVKNYDIHQVTSAVTNKNNKQPWEQKVTVVQNWLVGHGEKIQVNGKFDRSTNDALQRQYRLAAEHERRVAVAQVTKMFYTSGYQEGMKPAWWNQPGPIPSPAKLTAELQAGGFGADTLLRQILRSINVPQYEYAKWRDTELNKMVKTYSTAWDAPNWLLGSRTASTKAVQILTASARVLTPQAQAELSGQVNLLVNARTGDEFSRRIRSAVVAADLRYQNEQINRGAAHIGFWGQVARAALSPAVNPVMGGIHALNVAEGYWAFTKTAIVSDYFMASDYLEFHELQHPKADYWEGAAYALSHPPNIPGTNFGGGTLGFANTFVADPLMYVRPFRIASTILTWGSRAFLTEEKIGLGAYKLGRAANTGIHSFERARGFEMYDGATWHIPIKSAYGTRLRSIPMVSKALTAKTELVDTAQRKLTQAAWHGFQPPRKLFDKLGVVDAFENRVSKTTRKMLTESRDDLAKIEGFMYPAWLDSLKSMGASFYADAHYTAHSMFGGRVVAHRAEMIRVQEVVRAATKYASNVEFEALHGGLAPDVVDSLKTKHLSHLPDDAPEAQRREATDAFWAEVKATAPKRVYNKKAAAQQFIDEYHRVKDSVGGFFSGGTADPELRSAIDERVKDQLAAFTDVELPALQLHLENHFESIGHDLWNPETGRWVGALGSQEDAYQQALEAFSPSRVVMRENPNFNVEMSHAAATVQIQSEIRIKTARLRGFFERQEAAGNPFPESVKAAMYGRASNEIVKSYVEGDFQRHIVVNPDTLDEFLISQGLPLDTEVVVVNRPQAPWLGMHHGDKLYLNSTREMTGAEHGFGAVLDLPDGSEISGTEFIREQYHETLAHEVRHAFQKANMTEYEMEVLGTTVKEGEHPYWDQPIEKDAREFAASDFVRGFDSLVTVVEPRGGFVVDGRKYLPTPDIYSRDLNESYFHHEPSEYMRAKMETQGSSSVLATLPAVQRVSDIDREIGRAVWNGGTMHEEQLSGAMQRGWGHDKSAVADFTAINYKLPHDASDAEKEYEAALLPAHRQVVAKAHIAVGTAMNEALPYALRQQHLVAAALSTAQSWPMRSLYKLIWGGLNVWIFATLPLRAGWVVRNVVDNTLKIFIAGARDPREYFRVYQGGRIATALGDGLQAGNSIFHAGISDIIASTRFLDTLFGTNVADHLQTVINTFWSHNSQVIENVFRSHGLDIDPEVIAKMQLNPFAKRAGAPRITRTSLFDPSEVDELPQEYQDAYKKHFAHNADEDSKWETFRDKVWEFMANRPENYAKKVLYNTEKNRLRKQGVGWLEAHDAAWKKVEETLFDYSQITAIEDNLRVFFPFIQFWRKNTGLWARNFAQNPWLTVEMNNYMNWRNNIHSDEPQWMRRYFSTKEITDATASIPDLNWLASNLLPNDGQFDPMSFLSFSPYYRAFKSENPNLPDAQKGMAFIGPMLDAINEWGLGVSPFVRKPLESVHVASVQSWQTVFPETPVAAALTREFVGDQAAKHVMDWEWIFSLGFGRSPGDMNAQSFEFYVRRAEENQVAKGLPINRADAEANIRMWFLTQNLWGYFGGLYWRRNTPEDYYTNKLQDELIHGEKNYADLSERDKTILSMWSKGGVDKKTGRLKMNYQDWERYTENIPLIEAYYKQDDFPKAQKLVQENPELRQYVDPKFSTGKYFSANYAKAAALYMRGAEWFDVDKLLKSAGVPYEMIKAARSILITPELQAFWAKNDTPAQVRNKMVSAELHSYLSDMQDGYFAIPESDKAARREYIAMHPQMEQMWQANNDAPDDFKLLDTTFKSHARNVYFDIVKSKGFEAAAGYLKEFPFIFEGTKSESHIDEARGIWVPGGKGSKRGNAYLAGYNGMQYFFRLAKQNKKAAFDWLNSDTPDAKAAQFYFDHYGSKHNTARAVAFREARAALRAYFNIRDSGQAGSKAAASAWLQADTPEAKIARDYFDKWSKSGSYHAHDFLRAEKWLKLYWAMPKAERAAWLKSNAPGAKIVRTYFSKWADDKKGLSAQAQAYAEAKDALDHYFSIKNKAARDKWLHGGSKDAALVLDYFKRFSATAKIERAFRNANPELATTDPELRQRMTFWRNFYSLPADERPQYILDHAASYGVFVYGALGDHHADAAEQKFIRAAMASTVTVDGKKKHMSLHEATYLYVKPLLNQLYTIPSKDRDLFIKANPELQRYLAEFGKKLTTGNPKLDSELQAYFAADQGSLARASILKGSPELQAYFAKHSTPAQRAIFSMLNTFFSLKGRAQAEFKLEHPEIQSYFDLSRIEKAKKALVYTDLELADPRLHDAFATATVDEAKGAAHMRNILMEAHRKQYTPDALTRRRDRGAEKKPILPVTKARKPA